MNQLQMINRMLWGGNPLLIDLVSCWEFNETSGTTAIDSHGTQNGIYSLCTLNQTGILDKSITVNAGGHVLIGDNDAYSFTDGENDVSFSISQWVKFTSVTGRSILINKRSGLSSLYEYQCYFTNNLMYFSISDVVNSGVSQNIYNLELSTGLWYHFVFKYDTSISGNSSDKLVLHINDQIITPSALGNAGFIKMHNTTQPLNIGNLSDASTGYAVKGTIDQTAIWRRALTDAEISTLYNSGNGKSYPFL
jgi:hypothetical protein